jgi:hypothetical protein
MHLEERIAPGTDFPLYKKKAKTEDRREKKANKRDENTN